MAEKVTSTTNPVPANDVQSLVRKYPEQKNSPVRPLPRGEDFNCNESEWKNGVAGLTTFALRNAVTLFKDVCDGSNSDVNTTEAGKWYVVNSGQAADTNGAISGRTWNYMAADKDAALVQGNLVCRDSYDKDDLSDNKQTLNINLGIQDIPTQPVVATASIDIDDDFNTAEHTAIAKMLDTINMPAWSNRLVWYFGAVVPQGFFCKGFSFDAIKSKFGSYVQNFKDSITNAAHGFETTDKGIKEKRDGVLIFVDAWASAKNDEETINGAAALLSLYPKKDDLAGVMYEAWHFEKALELYNNLGPDSSAEARQQVKTELENVQMFLGMYTNLMQDDKEIKFVIENEINRILNSLVICDKKQSDCGKNQVLNSNCECVDKARPQPKPRPKPQPKPEPEPEPKKIKLGQSRNPFG